MSQKSEVVWHDTPGRCPACGITLRYATSALVGAAPPRPRPGDVTVCEICGEVLLFEQVGVRRPTAAELVELRQAPQWATVEQVSRGIRRRARS